MQRLMWHIKKQHGLCYGLLPAELTSFGCSRKSDGNRVMPSSTCESSSRDTAVRGQNPPHSWGGTAASSWVWNRSARRWADSNESENLQGVAA